MQIVERHFFNKTGNDETYFARLFGAARRFHKHGHALDTQAELVQAVGSAFWDFIRKCRDDSLLTDREMRRLFWQRICQVRVARIDGKDVGGFIVLHGELKALWCDVPGRGQELIRYALTLGAQRLQCFDGHLVGLYSQFAFKVITREPNWAHGEPDLVTMEIRHEGR